MEDLQKPCGIWYYGPPGTGKSHAVRQAEPNLFIKSQSKWWDGYNNEEAVLLDDFDFKDLGHLIKIWTDQYKKGVKGEVKGGTVALPFKRFYITSNYKPEDLWAHDIQTRDAILRRC